MALYTAEFSKRLELLKWRMDNGELTDRNYRLLNIHLALKEHIGKYRERPRVEDLLILSDMILDEELRWSHPDKMTLIEYPFTSESQEDERKGRYCLVPDVIFGDRRANGKQTSSHTDDDGNVTSSKGHITLAENEEYSRAEIRMIVRDALANANLTQRQKEAIYLVFYKRMTQEEAADVLNVSQPAIRKFIRLALDKLRKYLEELGLQGYKITV